MACHASVSCQKFILEMVPASHSAINNYTLPVISEGIWRSQRMSNMTEMDRSWQQQLTDRPCHLWVSCCHRNVVAQIFSYPFSFQWLYLIYFLMVWIPITHYLTDVALFIVCNILCEKIKLMEEHQLSGCRADLNNWLNRILWTQEHHSPIWSRIKWP